METIITDSWRTSFCLSVIALIIIWGIWRWVRKMGEQRFKDGLFADFQKIAIKDFEKVESYFWRFTARIPLYAVNGQKRSVEVPYLAVLDFGPETGSGTFRLIVESREKICNEIQRLGYGRLWASYTFEEVVSNVELTINKEIARITAEIKAQAKAATVKKTVKAKAPFQKWVFLGKDLG